MCYGVDPVCHDIGSLKKFSQCLSVNLKQCDDKIEIKLEI